MIQDEYKYLACILGFSKAQPPFIYLAIPIFMGRPKTRYFQFIVDIIILKLSSCKAFLLSMTERLQLVKSVAQSMIIHSIKIYDWSVKFLLDIERWIRNFLWSGDVMKIKLINMAWNKCCKDFNEGNLELRFLIILNKTTTLKHCWNFLINNCSQSSLLKYRVLRNIRPIKNNIFSSIWYGMKSQFMTIQDNSSWPIGNGMEANFGLMIGVAHPL